MRLNRTRKQHRVRRNDQLTVGLPDIGNARRDLFDQTLDAFPLHLVTNPQRLVRQNENARDKVYKDILDGQPDGNGTDPESRQKVARRQIGKQDRRVDQQPDLRPAPVRGAMPNKPEERRLRVQGPER